MLTEMLGRRGSRLLPVVVMIAAAALLAGAPHAHADGHPTPAVSTEHPSPTGAETIAFRLAFDKLVDLATFDASDISVSSGTVQNLHSLLRHDGNIEDAGFDYPSDVAVNASGYIYVADARSNRVAIFDPDRRFNGTFPGDFNQPGGVTIDGSGNVYVADTYNHRIKIFDSALRLNDTIVRDFNHPFSVAVDDASGRIYVADTFADRVQVFHANWSRISYMTGFNDPYDVAVDGSGNLHVAVALEDRVRIFNSTLDSIHNITSLNRPRGVAVDSLGTTYVANTAYNQIRIYDTALDQVASIENSFTNPYDVAIDGPRSTVYVADRNRDRIQVFNMTFAFEVANPDDGQTLTVSVPAGGVQDAAGNDNLASNTVSIEIDRTGPPVPTFATAATGPTSLSTVPFTLEFSKGINASTFDASDINASAGTVQDPRLMPQFDGTLGMRGQDDGQFNQPAGVAVDGSGALYVADSSNNRVQVFDSATGAHVATFGGDDQFNYAGDVAVDGSTGAIYVADRGNNTVQVFNSSRDYVAELPFEFDSPSGVAVDGSTGAIYVADRGNNAVQIFDSNRTHVGNITSLRSPFGVAVDGSAGVIYVANTINNTVPVFDSDTLARMDDLPGPFRSPGGVAVDGSAGAVYVANTGNNTVQIFNSTTGAYVGDLPGPFRSPFGMAVDGSTGAIHVADSGNNTVQIYDTAYAFNVTDLDDGDVLNVSMQAGRVRDSVGYGNVESNTVSITIDRRGPTPIISAAQSGPTDAPPIRFEVDFREPVDGFEAGDIVLSGTARDGSAAGLAALNATAYSFVVWPTADGTILVDIPEGAAEDKAGNDNAAAERFSIEYDSPPVPFVNATRAGPANASTINFRVNFGEDVTGFDLTDVAVSGDAAPAGGAANLTNSSDSVYAFDVSPAGDGIVTVGIASGAAEDAAGNPSEAARFSIRSDGAGPTPAIASTVSGPANLRSVPFTMRFSEAVDAATLAASDIKVSSGAVQGFRAALHFNQTITRDAGELSRPRDVAVDGFSGTIYVASSDNNAVRVFDSSGNRLADLPGPFSSPWGVEVDAAGRIYVANSGNSTVQIFDSDGNHVADLRGPFSGPIDVAVDGEGRIYVANWNDHTVRVFDSSRNYVADLPGEFDRPVGVAVDASTGHIYVADTFRSRVQIFDSSLHLIGNITGLTKPLAVAADGPSGAIYVAEGYVAEGQPDRVKIFNSTTRAHVADLPDGYGDPYGVAVDASSGTVYVADTLRDRVMIYDAAYEFSVEDPADGQNLTVSVPAGRVLDAAGNPNAESNTVSIAIATGPIPTVASLQGLHTNAPTINFTVTFDEPVTGFNASAIALSGDADPGPVADFSGSGAAYAFSTMPARDGTVTVRVAAGAVEDALGNPSFAADLSVTYDTEGPSTTVTADQGSPTSASAITFTVRFSDTVAGFNASGIAITGTAEHGGAGDFATADNMTYTFVVAPTSDGTILVDVPAGAARDLAGNDNDAAERLLITRDTAPVPTITSDAQSDPTSESPIGFTVTFSENVTGFVATEIEISGIASGIDEGSFDPVNATTYTFAVSPPANGTVTVDVPANVAADAGGNNNTAAAQFSIEYNGALPAAPPIPTITSAQPDPTNVSPIRFTVNFTKPVTGFGATDVAISGIASGIDEGSFATADNRTYTFAISPTTDGTLLVDVPANVARDADGSNNTAASFSITYDNTGPIPTVASPQGLHTNASPINFTVTFDENVTGFNATHIALSGDADPGPVADFDGTGAAYTFTVAPTTDGTVTVEVAPNAVRDALGNPSPAADLSVTYDTEGPSTTVTADQGSPTNASAITFTVRFSDTVAGFNASGIAITGTAEHGGAGNLTTADNMTYTFVVAPTSDGTILVDVPAGAARDLAGNDNDAAERLSITRDALTPTFATTATGPASLSIVPFTLEFSKGINASTFDDSDINVTSGSVENLRALPKLDAYIGSQGTEAGQFITPSAVAIDSAGSIYVSDTPTGTSSRVQVFDSDGNYAASLPGPLNNTIGVAIDGAGNIYAANSGNGTVQVFDSDGNYTADLVPADPFNFLQGVAVDGTAGKVYVSDLGLGTVLIFDSATRAPEGSLFASVPDAFPGAVAADGAGKVYVAMQGNGTVQVFDSAGNHVAALPGPFDSPSGMASDAFGNVYVVNGGNGTVQIFGPDREHVAALPGTFVLPNGIAVDNSTGSVYVVDNRNHTVQAFVPAYAFDVVDPADEQVLNVSMQAGRVRDTAGNGNVESNTASITIDRTGPTPIISAAQSSPTDASRIVFEVDFREPVDGFEVGDIVLSGNATHGGVDGLAVLNATAYTFGVSPTADGTIQVDIPEGAVEDRAGNDNAAAERFSIEYDASAPIPVITAARPSPTGESPISFTVTFNKPVTMFAAGNITLSGDANPGPVANFTNASATTYTFDVEPSTDGTVRVDVPDGAALDALDRPSTKAARFWITYDGASPTPTIAAAAAPGPASLDAVPFTVKFDEDMGASAVDVSSIDASSGTVQDPRLAPQHVATFGGFGGLLPLRDNTKFNAPSGVAVDGSGNIYVADTNNNRVQVFDSSGNHSASLPGPFHSPRGIAVDGSGNIYVTDVINDTVRVFDSDMVRQPGITGTLDSPDAVAVDGAGNVYVLDTTLAVVQIFDSERAPVANLTGPPGNPFRLPAGVAVDGSGNVYVADTNNNRVLAFGPDRNYIADLPGPFNRPAGVAADGSGNVYVADTGNNRTKIFDSARNYVADLPGPFNRPVGVAADGAGRVYVSDRGNHTVSIFDTEYAFNVTGPADGDVLTVTMPAGSVLDAAGNPSNESNTVSITIDRTGPIPTVASPQGLHTNASPINFTVTFDENVTGFNATHIALSGDADPGPVADFDGTGAAYTFTVAPTTDGTVTVEVAPNAVRDALGNPSPAADLSVTYDTEGPSTTVTADQGSPTNASAITFTVRFSDTVAGFNASGIAITGTAEHGGAGNLTTADNMTYTFVVALTSDGTILVDVPAGAARDLAGNDNDAAERLSITRDTSALIPTITSGAGPGPTSEPPIAFTVNFTRPVTGFEAGDVVISGAATGIDAGSFATADNKTYTFAVSPSANGTVTVDVPANVAADAGGNNNTAAAQFSIEYNGAPPAAPQPPVPTITSDAGPGPTSESPIAFTVTFDRPVTGFNASGIEISGAATGIDEGSFVAVNATTYTFAVSPSANGTVTVDVPANVAADAGGNNNTAAAQFLIEYNGAPPAAPQPPVPTITSDAGPGPTSESPIAFTVTFDRPVTGFNASGIEISGAATGIDEGSFVAVNATTYTFAVSPSANGTVTVDVPANVAADAGGNNNTAAAQFLIEYNGARPGTNATVLSAAITGPLQATIRYSEAANAVGSPYSAIVIGGTARQPIGELQGNGTATHTIQFDGDPAARDATGTVTIDQAALTDPSGNHIGNGTAYRQALADGQAPVLASAVLDLTAGENGLLTLEFDEAVATAPAAPLSGEIIIRGDGGGVALSGSDVPSVASGRAGDATFALDITGAKRIELNAADLGSAAIELPAAFVSDAPGNSYAPGQSDAPLAYAPDTSPPRLAAAAFNLAPAGAAAGRLVITFDEATTAPGAESFPGMIEIRGRSWGGDASVSLSADDVISVESGSAGDRTFVLLVSDRARAALDATAFSDLESTTLLLPAGFVTDGRSAHAPERAPLDVARDPDRPTFLLAFVLNGSSIAAVYSEPVLAVPSHYANITVDGAAVAGNRGGASEAAAFGNNVIISWNANASTTAAAGSAVGFDLSANVTDAFGNPVENPGTKYTGGPDGTGQAGKQPVQVGVFARGAGDPSMGAARLGAAAFNAVSEERGYQFYVSVSEHDLPAGASGAAALRGAHGGGSGPSLYVGPASDTALAGMAGYASENGITIISHSSAARSLAVGGDPIFRMEPGAAHMARALATEVARGGYGAIVPVVQAGLHGPDYGLLESLESDIGPLGISFGEPVEFVAGGGGAAAAPVETAVAAAAGSGTARSVAVVYMGSDAELAAMAGSAPAGGAIRERSAWFAVGGAGAGAGSGVAASPAITADAAAIQLARDTRLSAVQFAVERNSMTDYIDRIAAPLVPAASATPAYAAYEAVRALGGALVGAGGDPSLAGGNIAGAANLEGGPLGRTGMDGNGDLRLPVTYGIWSVSDASAEWARAPELLRGLDACGIDLEKSALALPELSAGSTSRPARQTVTNIGTGPMPAVSVSATDWTQFRDGAPLPGPLPFSYTEMAVGLGGASPRPADSTPLAADTAIPGGTPPGGSVDVDFRINLGDLDTLEADTISQTVTFVANCV